jgi:hypothetical protein
MPIRDCLLVHTGSYDCIAFTDWRVVCDVPGMSKLPLSGILVAVGLLWPVSAVAQSSEEADGHPALAASSLFDAVGAPLMRISGPIYLQLGVRDKVRGLNNGSGDNPGASGSGAGSSGDAPAGSGTGTGGGTDADGDSGDGSDSGGTIPIGGGDQTGDDGPPSDGDIRDVPEPALLSLIIPGALLALRRRAQRRRATTIS